MTDKTRNQSFNAAQGEQVAEGVLIQKNTRDEIMRLLGIARDEVTLILAGQPTDYQLWQLPKMQQDINRVLLEYEQSASGVVSQSSNNAWSVGQAAIELPLAAGGIVLRDQLLRIDTQQLDAMRMFMTDRIQNIGQVAINQINQSLGLVIIGSKSPSEAIGEVQTILGDESRARATTITRTEISRIYETANYERSLQAVEFVPGLQKQWRRSGKIHSRSNHDAADGQVRNVDENFIIMGKYGPVKMRYPKDPRAPAAETINCGCISLRFMAHWDMGVPGRKAYTQDELLKNPLKAAAQPQLIAMGTQLQSMK